MSDPGHPATLTLMKAQEDRRMVNMLVTRLQRVLPPTHGLTILVQAPGGAVEILAGSAEAALAALQRHVGSPT